MKNVFTNLTSNKKTVVYLLGALMLVIGLLFSASMQPAFASSQMQAATGTATVGVSPTAAATTSGTPAAGAATVSPVPSLAAPGVTGTPTVLVPVTGADLTPPGSGWATALRVFAGLLGLLLIGFGLRSYRLGKR